jgi:[ribosomal protein S5]-alanine N-acetyltransferase
MAQPELPLYTDRLTLRTVRSGDSAFFQQLYADWQVAQYLLRTPAPFTEAHAQMFIDTAIAGLAQQHTYMLIIECSDVAEAIGVITLRVPAHDSAYSLEEREEECGLGILGYAIVPSMWGQGYASESARRMIDFGFTALELDRIQASPLQTNTASRRMLERLGFTISEADILEEPLHGGPPQFGDCYMLYRS